MHGFHGGSKCPEGLSFLSGVSGGCEAKTSLQHEAATRGVAGGPNPLSGPHFGSTSQMLGPLIGTGRLQWASPSPAAISWHMIR